MKNIVMIMAGLLMGSVACAGERVHFDFESLPASGEVKGQTSLVTGLAGKALKVGDEGELLSFLRLPNDGLFAPDKEVSVGFWVSPLDWNGNYDGFLFLFRACEDDNTGLRLYKYEGTGGFLWYLVAERAAGAKKTEMQYAHARIGKWKAGEWHHVVLTYRPGGKTFIGKECRQRLFVDGKLAGAKTVPDKGQPTHFPAHYVLGPVERWKSAAPYHSAIDEFKIWDHELTPAEVRTEFLKFYRGGGDETAELTAGLLPEGADFDAAFEKCATGSNVFIDRRGLLQQRIAAPEVRVAATPSEFLVRIREDVRALKLKTAATRHDGEVYFDDAYEVLVQMGDKPLRQYIINAIGTVYDGRGMDGTWNGTAKVASAVKHGVWEIRLRIPARDLERTGFAVGDDIRLGIGRDLMAFGQREYVANCGICGFFHNVKRYQHIRVGGAGTTGVKATVEFRAPNIVRVNANQPVAWEYEDGGTTAVFRVATAGERALPMGESSARYDGVLKSADGVFVLPLSVMRESSMAVSGELDPDTGSMTVSIRLADEKQKAALKSATVRMTRGGKTLGEFPYAEKIVLTKAQQPKGSGDIDVAILSKSLNRPLVGRWNYYDVDSDRWMNYAGGLDDDDVPTPWVPVATKGDALTCLDREYRLGGSFLPRVLKEKGRDILASSIRLLATVDGKAVELSAVPIHVTRQQRGRLDLVGKGTIAGCKVTAQVVFEFDGFYWVTCDIRRQGHDIRNLAVEIPLAAETSQLKFVPFVNEKAVQRDDVGETFDVQQWAFGPGLWVGGDQRGLTFFTESDECLRLADPARCYALTKREGRATLRFNMITSKEPLPEELRYGFGLQVTPVKPFPQPKDWMKQGFVRAPNQRVYISGWGNHIGSNYQGMPGFDGCPNEERSWASMRRQVAALVEGRCEGGVDYGVPLLAVRYLCPNMVAATLPELSAFRRYWEVLPSDVWGTDGPDGVPFVRVSPMSQSWANFYCWRFNRYFAASRENGMYQDFGHPIRDMNPLHGAGYERDGKRHTTYALVKYRELNKRLYRIAKKYETPDRPIFFIGHSGGSFVLPHGNFWTLTNDGEYLGGVANELKPYTQFLTPGRIRAEFNGRPHGILFNFIPVQGKERVYNEDMFSYIVPACVTWMHHACINGAVQKRCWNAYATFGFTDVAGFHPFWEKGDFFTTDADARVMTSVLEKSAMLLVACGNPTEAKQSVKTHFTAPITSFKLEGGAWQRVADGHTISFDVLPRNFAYVLIKR